MTKLVNAALKAWTFEAKAKAIKILASKPRLILGVWDYTDCGLG